MYKPFPVLCSKPETQYLLQEVKDNYYVSGISDCRLIASQMNDTYLLLTNRNKYILRVYRAGRKTYSDILYEMEILNHLNKKGVPVSIPLKKRDGQFLLSLDAPEGQRYAVLFTYIDGNTPFGFSKIDYYSFGCSLARIHKASEDFESFQSPCTLNLEYLLDKPLEKIEYYFSDNKDNWYYLRDLSDKLKSAIDDLPSERLDFGFCHGDSQPDNARVNNHGTITFLDFDSCGLGYRAYDLASFYWYVVINLPLFQNPVLGRIIQYRVNNVWMQKFFTGYLSIRKLNQADKDTIPLFAAIRHIWTLGLRAENVNFWGLKHINEIIITESIKFLKSLEKMCFVKPYF